MHFSFAHLPVDAPVSIQRLDSAHGNVLEKYASMGSPLDPTPDQAKQLNRETALGAPEQLKLSSGKLDLRLAPNTLLLISIHH